MLVAGAGFASIGSRFARTPPEAWRDSLPVDRSNPTRFATAGCSAGATDRGWIRTPSNGAAANSIGAVQLWGMSDDQKVTRFPSGNDFVRGPAQAADGGRGRFVMSYSNGSATIRSGTLPLL